MQKFKLGKSGAIPCNFIGDWLTLKYRVQNVSMSHWSSFGNAYNSMIKGSLVKNKTIQSRLLRVMYNV